ncbi:hypothetical protein [Kocuria arenosa]
MRPGRTVGAVFGAPLLAAGTQRLLMPADEAGVPVPRPAGAGTGTRR